MVIFREMGEARVCLPDPCNPISENVALMSSDDAPDDPIIAIVESIIFWHPRPTDIV